MKSAEASSSPGGAQPFRIGGRMVPEKRMDAVVRILEKVREAGHDVHLHILGGLDDSSFGARLQELAAWRPWVKLEGRTFGQKKIAGLYT